MLLQMLYQSVTNCLYNSDKSNLYCCNIFVGAQLRNQPILRWAIAQLRIRSWVAHLQMGWDKSSQLGIIQSNKFNKANFI